ncbi:MAG: AI-2E family transporter [Candidatus Peribacteraceae bacterium]|nr:AI-2E family transporter [Candidatus Peribacteraceae bacterium]
MQKGLLRHSFFLVLLVGSLILAIAIFLPFFVSIAVAATAAVMLHPVYRWIEKKVRNRSVAAFLTVLLSIVILLLPLSLIGVLVARQAAELYAQIVENPSSLSFADSLIAAIEDIVQRYAPAAELDLTSYAGQIIQWIAGNVQAIFVGTASTFLGLFLGIITFYYLLKDGDKFILRFTELSPLSDQDERKILSRLQRTINSVVRGSMIIASLQGIVTGIGLSIFGIPNAVLLGSIAAFGALIPTVGTSIVLAPVILYLFIVQDYFAAIGLLIWGAVAVGLIDNMLHPLLVGRGMRLHPLFIFFAVIGGIALFGIAGFILGPLVISLLAALLDVYREEAQQ